MLFAVGQPLNRLGQPLPVLRMGDLDHGRVEQGLLIVAQHPRPGGIDRPAGSVEPEHAHELVRVLPDPVALHRALGDLPFQLLARARQDLAGLNDLLDIRAGAEPARDPALLIPHRLGAPQHPTVLAGAMPQPVFDAIWLSRGQAVPPRGPGAFLIVGMENVGPAGSVRGALRHAGVVVPALVEEVVIAVRARGPDHLIDGVGDRLKLGLAFPQAFSASLRSVMSRTNSTASSPILRGANRPHQREPSLRKYCFS